MKQQGYQEALDLISNMNTMNLLTIGERSLTKPCVEKLQQLIDKLPYWLELEERDKPMKPLYVGNMVLCGKCYRNTIYSHLTNNKKYRCDSDCGQVVDWSDEE